MIECILIVGLGSIGTRHARLIRQKFPDVKLIALRHSNASGEGNNDIDCCVTSLQDALSYHPQAAVIANPATYHLEVAMPLARAGVHLLIEKPISHSSDGVLELVKICKEKQLILMVGYNLRFVESLRQFRDSMNSGLIGRVMSVRVEIGQWLPSWRPGRDYRQTVSARSELGGGVVLELSHELDYLRWLFGDIDWVSAIKRKQSDLEIDVEDTLHLVIGFNHAADQTPVVANVNMDFIRHDTTRSCSAIGENGTLRWDAVSGTLDLFEKGGKEWQNLHTSKPRPDQSYIEELEHFFACICEQSKPLISGQDGLKTVELIEAINQSALNESILRLTSQEPVSKSGQLN